MMINSIVHGHGHLYISYDLKKELMTKRKCREKITKILKYSKYSDRHARVQVAKNDSIVFCFIDEGKVVD